MKQDSKIQSTLLNLRNNKMLSISMPVTASTPNMDWIE